MSISFLFKGSDNEGFLFLNFLSCRCGYLRVRGGMVGNGW